MKINNRIKYIRNTLNLTQTKFSERIFISTSHLAGMELGDKKINERTIRLISSEFNINEHWVKTGEGEIFKNGFNNSLSQVTSVFTSLTPQSQTYILQQINALSNLERSLINKR